MRQTVNFTFGTVQNREGGCWRSGPRTTASSLEFSKGHRRRSEAHCIYTVPPSQL